MPTYQFHALLTRIGLALAAGVLIAIVPVAWRKTRYEPSIPRRIFFYVLALVALVAFGFYASYLWQRFAPADFTFPGMPPATFSRPCPQPSAGRRKPVAAPLQAPPNLR